MTAPRTLNEMQFRGTAYEVAINGKVVAYTERRTKSALLAVARDNGDAILAHFKADEDFSSSYSKSTGWDFGGCVTVAFTGRTEREAATKLEFAA